MQPGAGESVAAGRLAAGPAMEATSEGTSGKRCRLVQGASQGALPCFIWSSRDHARELQEAFRATTAAVEEASGKRPGSSRLHERRTQGAFQLLPCCPREVLLLHSMGEEALPSVRSQPGVQSDGFGGFGIDGQKTKGQSDKIVP